MDMSIALPIAALDTDTRSNPIADVSGPRDIGAVRTLRISVTDRCNFRCVYCMPEDRLDWIPRDELLTFEEIVTVARAAGRHGIRAYKITGGEPTLRHDLPALIAQLRDLPGTGEISMTTNGAQLDEHAAALRAAGLERLTVSMDTLDRAKFREITRGGDLTRVWDGIGAALAAGFRHPKINCVTMRGINDDEFADFAELTLHTDVTVRFIEYMPLGRTRLGGEYETRFISEEDIRAEVVRRLGPLTATQKDSGSGPANVFRLAGAKGRIGFISAMSAPFCSTCNRLRLTAQGQLRSCLFDGGEVELRPILRGGMGGEVANALHQAFVDCVAFKPEVHGYHGNRQMSEIGG
jgi:cyclic pyranopterin phosphate synthase